MNSDTSHSFCTLAGTLTADSRLEQSQTTQRLIISHIIIGYALVMGAELSPVPSLDAWAELMFLYYSLQTLVSLTLFWAARRWPGRNPLRRITGMVGDYGFLGLAITTNSIVMMPLYTIIIWVTLGNGLRYGRTYLFIATIFALLTVFAVSFVTYRVPTDVYVTIMVVMMVLAIPQYAASLMSDVEASRKEADEANIAKSRFLAQASHDLRQPIHAIGLFLNSLQQTGLRPAQQLIVDRIDRSLQGVARLFRSLLDLSTLDSGSVQVKPVPVALADLLSELVQQNSQLAQKDECDLRLVNVNYVILADRNLLMTMVQNLLSNAFKFASGRPILIGCRKRGATLSLQIWDQGDGIESVHLPRLFEEFYQVKGRGDKDQQGVGLGLTIVSRMAKLMGLSVQAASSPGKGSCFSIDGIQILPRTAITVTAQDAGVPSSPISDMRVLLVEDDIDILAATADLIDGWGCKTTAMEGVPTYLVDEHDLVIMDFDLGNGMTGADCLAAVRLLNGRDTPAIIVTAHDETWVAKEIADPDVLILKKPLRPSELRSAIGAARARRGASRR
jgi:signal transduction histidine kinase